MITKKATIAQVNFGFTQIEGLMLPSGEFAIAVTQVASLFQFPLKHTSRDFKALLGKDFQFPTKVTSTLNPRPVNIFFIPDFIKLVMALVDKNNYTAIALLKALAVESIERRFNNAFDQKVTEDEYNERLKVRMQGIQTRRTLTDAIKDYIIKHSITGNDAKFMYVNATNSLYISLSGCNAQKIRKLLKLDTHANVRDFLDAQQLKTIDNCEDLMVRLIDQQDINPLSASKHVANILLLENSLTLC
jgi:hypothetical protein